MAIITSRKQHRSVCRWSLILMGLCFLFPARETWAQVDFKPRAGVVLKPSLQAPSDAQITLLPLGNTQRIRYLLRSLTGPSGNLKTSRIRVKTPFNRQFQGLDQYRDFLSGVETGPIPLTFRIEKAAWNEPPGVFQGKLIPERVAPEIPVTVTITPKSLIALRPEKLTLRSSPLNDPIITEVEIYVTSNSRQWELAMIAGNLKLRSDTTIQTSRVRARIRKGGGATPWTPLDKPFFIAKGGPGPNRKVATLEFTVQSRKADPIGFYQGGIRFLIRNSP